MCTMGGKVGGYSEGVRQEYKLWSDISEICMQ